MTIRSDWTLELLLDETQRDCTSGDVRDAITAALTHIGSASKSRFRGGKILIDLLQVALATAKRDHASVIAERLLDALSYAEGRSFKHDIEDKYGFFSDGQRNPRNVKFVSEMVTVSTMFWMNSAKRFLKEHPTATAVELLENVRTLTSEAPFIDAPPDRPGRYRIVRGRAETAAWISEILQHRIDIEDPEEAARRIVTTPAALSILATDSGGEVLLQAAETQRRKVGLSSLRTIVENPKSSERDIHRAIQKEPWIFGGRFVGEASRRRLVPGDELDIPLLRPDGSLCVVELKKAMVPVLKRHRNAWVPTAEVNSAIGQAINYLRNLDEHRNRILADFRIDTRRATAIVLIGHPSAQPGSTAAEISEVFRTHNSHLSRVELVTYQELLDAAERSLTGHPS